VSFEDDPYDPVGEYLVSPDGDVVAYGQNYSNSGTTVPSTSLSAYALNPTPGRWTLIVDFAGASAGNEISQPYHGDVRFNTTPVRFGAVPNGPAIQLKPGQPVTIPVKITNTGIAPEDFFIDPRLDATKTYALAPLGSATNALPLTVDLPEWLVPSETSAVAVAQTSSLPAMFDAEPNPGDPDLSNASSGPGPLCTDSASVVYNPPGGTVTPGVWYVAPTECGPYSTAAPAGTVSDELLARTKACGAVLARQHQTRSDGRGERHGHPERPAGFGGSRRRVRR
jgi:hypothetical protein